MRTIIHISRLLSSLFRPAYYPSICFLLVFLLVTPSTLWDMPWPLFTRWGIWNMTLRQHFILALAVVIFFTVLLPAAGIYLYTRIKTITPVELRIREHRFIPYFINILCYMLCLQCLVHIGVPDKLWCIIISALLLQFICSIVNFWHKVSTHAAGAAGIVGAIIAYSQLFPFDPLWWTCIAILLWGGVASSRLVLRAHNLSQVLTGSLIGLLCGFWGILYSTLFINYQF